MKTFKTCLLQKAPTIVLLSTITCAWSLSAAGDCIPVNGWQNKSFNIAIPALVIARDAPIGTVVFSQTTIFPYEMPVDKCESNSPILIYTKYRNGMIPDSTGIAATNVPGIGVRIIPIKGENQTGYYGNDAPYVNLGGTYFYWKDHGFIFQLIKQGPTSTGTLSTGVYAGMLMKNLYWMSSINVTNGGSLSTPACEVTSTSIAVPMGSVKKSEFSGIGSTPGEKTFNILLNCNGNTNVKMTLNATADSSAAPGVIAVNSSSDNTVADGVGIQLLYKNSPLTLGAPITIGNFTSGPYQIPIVARYYQTKSTVTAGQANGVATFNFTYN